VRTLTLDPASVAKLRAYVLRGGMLCFDSIAGSPYFSASVHEVMKEAFPELAWRQIPADHPLYHMVTDVNEAHYSGNVPAHRPMLEGLYVGSRIGVLLSPYGLGCGWDNHAVPLISQAKYYEHASGWRNPSPNSSPPRTRRRRPMNSSSARSSMTAPSTCTRTAPPRSWPSSGRRPRCGSTSSAR
jgi:hypothetical protein